MYIYIYTYNTRVLVCMCMCVCIYIKLTMDSYIKQHNIGKTRNPIENEHDTDRHVIKEDILPGHLIS